MIKRLSLTFIFILFTMLGCQQQTEATEPTEATDKLKTKTLATVNSEVISEDDLNQYLEEKKAAKPDQPVDQEGALNEVITLTLVKQEAEKTDLDKREDVAAQIEQQRANLLINTFLREQLAQYEFSADELKKEYEQQITQISNAREYKARHILTKTEDEAKAVIAELTNGADFVELAKTKSTGPSGPQGGDLGWFKGDSMVAPFSQAVQAMKKGESSKTPVKTQFGWHVILLEDNRDLNPPAFEEVEEKLKQILANKSLQGYLNELRSKAKISTN